MVPSRKMLGLVLLGVLALGLRVWVVLALSTDHAAPLSYEHGRIAENLLAGRGFSIEFLGGEGPTSQQAPFYPLLLAVAYRCFGVGTPAAVLAVQLLQCLAGTALVLAVAWLAWSLLPDRPILGYLAAVGAAVYPTHLYMVTHLQVALWAALVLTLLLAVVVSPRWRTRLSGAALAGCLAGLLLLIEPILALALPICAAALWLSTRHAPRDGFPHAEREEYFENRKVVIRSLLKQQLRPLLRAGLMAGVATAIIAPWIVRNWIVHGRPVFVKSTFGYAFWQGNNPMSRGTDKIPKPSADTLRRHHDGTLAGMDRALWEARHETLYIDDVLLKPNGYREFAGLSEPQRSALLGRRAWQFVSRHPDQYLRLCLRRLRYFLLFDETNPKAANRIYRLATVTWLVLALIGLALSRRRWRALWPTYAIFAAVMAFHSLVIVSARFRISVEPLTFIWAAAAAAPLLEHLAPQRRIRIVHPGQRPRDPFQRQETLQGPHFDLPVRRRAG